jgi:drug/metabolite transporter (DMT)-like permease
MQSSPLGSRLLLMSAAILFSTGGAAIKGTTLTPWQVACLRSGIAAIALALFLPEARRSWTWRLAPVGLTYAATLIVFVYATKLTTAANAIFLQATAPLYVLLLAPLLLGEKARRSDLLFALAVCAGVALVFMTSESRTAIAPDPRTGNIFGGVAGITWALTLIGLRWAARGRSGAADPAIAIVVLGNTLACAATLPMALPLTHLDAANLSMMVYLGVVQIGLAYVCFTRGIRNVPAFEAATIGLLEPALNPIWTWLVHGEKPGAAALAGGAVILSATLANTWRQSRGAKVGAIAAARHR